MNNRKWYAAMILFGACGSIAAQQMSQGDANQRLMEQASRQAGMSRSDTFGDRYNEHLQKGMISLAAARKSLAAEWQKLGLSPEQATAVASTYRADTSAMLNHPSLERRSDKEVSAMIQQALASKNYRMANQLLIDYERQKLHVDSASAQR
jgi:hypothetical protein